jgi:hypothetical protein
MLEEVSDHEVIGLLFVLLSIVFHPSMYSNVFFLCFLEMPVKVLLTTLAGLRVSPDSLCRFFVFVCKAASSAVCLAAETADLQTPCSRLQLPDAEK